MTGGTVLVDAAARLVVTDDLDRTLFVEAGAGSGKTRSLVERVVNLVDGGVPITQIAAITFTEAAARELRTRVRDELERRAAATGRPHLLQAASQVEGASFTTLHGFALRLLSDHPVEAGLPPGFGVVDEIASILDFQEAWRVFAGRIGDDLDLLELQERASVLGAELGRFVEVARRFDDNWDVIGLIDPDPKPLPPLRTADLLDAVVGLRPLATHCTDPDDILAAGIRAVADQAEAWLGLDPLDQLVGLQAGRDGLRWPPGNRGRAANWTGTPVADARRAVSAVRADIEAQLDQHTREVMDHMVAHVARFVEQRVAARRAAGELAFHDLLVLARRLLRTRPDVRALLHQRYRRILLDEFQDTDPIQIELAVLLSARGEVGERHWQDLATELEPGRLVVVGDPKQSIYRFRRADIGVYSQAGEALVDGPVRLTTNFRSVPGVVAWVNAVFGAEMGDGVPEAQPAYTPLTPHRAPDPERLRPPVVVLGGPHERTVPVGRIRELEAADVAAVVCRAVEEGWRTRRDGHWAPVRLRDIAVLIPSRLSLPALEAAFGATGVPFRPETSSLVYATQEVRDVLAALRAVADPGSSIDVVAALRSALFAVGDDDLLSWHRAGGGWDYRTGTDHAGLAPGGDHPVARAFAALAAWHHGRWWTSPSALIDRIVRERRLREAALAEPRPRDRWRRYRFLAEQAREFEATRAGDLADFVAWAEIQASDLARVTEPIPAEPDDDVVRVLTVHGSKGLEFPLVILAGAPTGEQSRAAGTRVLFPQGGAPEVKVGGGSTVGFDLHASVEEVLDGHERVRLHYVATTRARDLLVVSAHHKEGTASSGLRTWTRCGSIPELWTGFERRGDETCPVVAPTQLRLDDLDHAAAGLAWEAEQDGIRRRASRAAAVSATGLARRLRAPGPIVTATVAEAGEEPDPELQPWRRGRAGTAVGSAVHAVLQQVDLDPDVDLTDQARLRAEQEGVGELAGEVAAMARLALTSDAVSEARNRRHWRELYVARPLGPALIEGYIDLCYETPDGLVIVDYKTDPVTSEAEADARMAGYRIQGAVYALALAHVTGRPVSGCRFVFVGAGTVFDRELTDLDAARDDVVAELTGR